MNEELYEKLETGLAKRYIDEEMGDILLGMAKIPADKNVPGKEISYKRTIGRTPLKAVGFCEVDEEYPNETSVYVKTLTVTGTVYKVEDYPL